MSDQSSVPVSTAPAHAVSFEHELFWAEIRTLFAEALQNVQPRMGTVLDYNGSMLNVLPDDSAVFRALPHLAGRRYKPGDRVILAPVQGKPIIIGGVLSSVGAEEAVVGMDDLAQDVRDKFIAYDAELADHEERIVTAQTTADGAVKAIGEDGGTSDASTGLYKKVYKARELADEALTTIGKDHGTSTNSTGMWAVIHAADEHAQNVFETFNPTISTLNTEIFLRSTTGIGGSSLVNKVQILCQHFCFADDGTPDTGDCTTC